MVRPPSFIPELEDQHFFLYLIWTLYILYFDLFLYLFCFSFHKRELSNI